MTTGTFSIQESLTFGWETFKKDPWFYVGVTLGLFVISMVANALTSNGYGHPGLLGFIVSFIVSAVLAVSYAKVALSAEAGKHVELKELWAPEHFLNMLGATILQSVVIFVGIILLIIPGIIAALMLCFSQLSVVDKKMNPIEAMKNSYYVTKGQLLELFLFALVLIVLNVVGLIALVVGLLVTVPVSLIAVARVYRILSGRQEPVVVVEANEAIPS